VEGGGWGEEAKQYNTQMEMKYKRNPPAAVSVTELLLTGSIW
jgi:hypothetical protein